MSKINWYINGKHNSKYFLTLENKQHVIEQCVQLSCTMELLQEIQKIS